MVAKSDKGAEISRTGALEVNFPFIFSIDVSENHEIKSLKIRTKPIIPFHDFSGHDFILIKKKEN